VSPSQTLAVTPNLDGESQPHRLKLTDCLTDIKEVTSWDEQETLAAAQNLCHLRQLHTKQKARFLADQQKLREQYQGYTNHGFNKHLPNALEDSWTIVKSCIDFREGFTYPHNIGILQVPENIRINCYSLGAEFLESALFK
jgi:hypothetical protein